LIPKFAKFFKLNVIITLNLLFAIFSFNNQRIHELVDYLTVMPPDGSSHDRGHKYPFLANQIFSEGGDGVPVIIEQFFYSK